MEHSFPRKLERLRQLPIYDDLLFSVEGLLLYASQQHVNGASSLKIYTDSPRITQAVWQGDEGILYHQDTVGITVLEDGLIVGIHAKEPSEPRRHVVIGQNYANYSEYETTRPSFDEQSLNEERLTLFMGQFEEMTAKLGLIHTIKKVAA